MKREVIDCRRSPRSLRAIGARDSDEESDVITTDACSRTRRLSDAGEDLTYLYHWKDSPGESTRLEGFVTSDLLYQKQLDLAHYSGRIASPVPGIVVQLQGPDRTRYAETGEHGRFVFDALPEGPYTRPPSPPPTPQIRSPRRPQIPPHREKILPHRIPRHPLTSSALECGVDDLGPFRIVFCRPPALR